MLLQSPSSYLRKAFVLFTLTASKLISKREQLASGLHNSAQYNDECTTQLPWQQKNSACFYPSAAKESCFKMMPLLVTKTVNITFQNHCHYWLCSTRFQILFVYIFRNCCHSNTVYVLYLLTLVSQKEKEPFPSLWHIWCWSLGNCHLNTAWRI